MHGIPPPAHVATQFDEWQRKLRHLPLFFFLGFFAPPLPFPPFPRTPPLPPLISLSGELVGEIHLSASVRGRSFLHKLFLTRRRTQPCVWPPTSPPGGPRHRLPAHLSPLADPNNKSIPPPEEERYFSKGRMVLICNACNAEFDGEELQRQHYRSGWHRYNLKRKVDGVRHGAGQPVAVQADALELAEAADVGGDGAGEVVVAEGQHPEEVRLPTTPTGMAPRRWAPGRWSSVTRPSAQTTPGHEQTEPELLQRRLDGDTAARRARRRWVADQKKKKKIERGVW